MTTCGVLCGFVREALCPEHGGIPGTRPERPRRRALPGLFTSTCGATTMSTSLNSHAQGVDSHM
eukprot:749181-Prorocentrum_minimum.AAC.1